MKSSNAFSAARSVVYGATALLLAACAGAQFNVPPVTQAADGSRQPGRIIWHDLSSDAPEQSRKFYSELFQWQFEPLPGINYSLIRHRGDLIGGMVDQTRLPTSRDVSQWVALMSVDDVEAATRELRDAGGTVFTPPTSLGDRGRVAVVADAQGAVLALLETRDGDPPDSADPPPPGRIFWNELWANDVAAASRFYRRLVPLEAESLDLGIEGVDYQVLTSGDRPRAGIRTNPVASAEPMWVGYLRVESEAALEAILARVESLGGQVLLPATSRPTGGKVAVITGPSGAGIALQTWEPGQGIVQIEEKP